MDQKHQPGDATVAILLYERMTVLDAVGPYEVLRSVPGVTVKLVAKRTGLVRPDSGLQMLNAEYALADVERADILVIPGGAAGVVAGDAETLGWIRRIDATTTWTTSVCTGSIALGAAGLLRGVQATSHWMALEALRKFGATPVQQRVVREGKIITAAGVSAGIDMALALVALTHGEEMARMVQLIIEYDPHPPFDSGSPTTATPATLEKARALLQAMYA